MPMTRSAEGTEARGAWQPAGLVKSGSARDAVSNIGWRVMEEDT